MKLVACWLCVVSLHGQGLFEGHSDVGAVKHAGAVEYDAKARTYTLSGSGENMWATVDQFHYVWKKMTGDVRLEADVAFLTKTGNAHKKAVLMIRQSLDTDSPYVDAAIHVDGLTSLQSRGEKGGRTHEVGLNNASPRRVRLEKRGDYFYMFLAREGEDLKLAGGSMRLPMTGEFYVGLGVCAHDADAVEKAVFSNVQLGTPATGPEKLYSTLETVTIASTDRRVVMVVPGKIEAPNWTPDGGALIVNGDGKLKRVPVAGGKVETIETGFASRINNDHGISPDGKMLAISDSTKDGKSVIYTLPYGGGEPKRITKNMPSYWHGWSPDGKTLTYCGQRDGKFDIYTIPVEGGEETRLTQGEGHNDGPEYSPDGKHIYFNSSRGGTMQVWRMLTDGSGLEQITSGEANNWFPHISPDGKTMVYLSYGKDVTGHPANKDVTLYVMTLADRQIKVLAKLFGGQGTINVPSWSPDSTRLSFVSYQLLP
jgi:TolB protein